MLIYIMLQLPFPIQGRFIYSRLKKIQKKKYNLSKFTALPTIVLLYIWHLAEISSSSTRNCLNLALRLTSGISEEGGQGGDGEFWAWKSQLQLWPRGDHVQVQGGKSDLVEQEQIIAGQAD